MATRKPTGARGAERTTPSRPPNGTRNGQAKPSTNGAVVRGPRPTLLLVDDHAGSLHLMSLEVREWPEASRFGIETVSGGRAAVEFIERGFAEKRPMFVLCDVRMAGLTGLDVLRAVVGRSTAPFRFVLTTAGEHPGLEDRAFSLGVDDFVPKENRPGALWESVGGRLGRWLRACEAPAEPKLVRP
jgi:CheY-like chemotaxis protein